jgi:ubiquinone/menaquinone biosynthesis C-methylase UbiE
MARVDSLNRPEQPEHSVGPSGPTRTRPATNPGTVAPDALRRLARLARRLKQRIRTLLDAAPGQRILDVGCGTGADAASLVRKVGPNGRVCGIDYDPAMIRHARRLIGALQPAPSLLVADAGAMPYRDASFDGCSCERVLQHVEHPATVVAEMVRVTRPGGRIVIADTDWSSLSIDALEAGVERRLVGFVAESLRNGYAGRQLRRLMHDAGIEDVHVEPWPLVWTDYGQFCATSLSLLDMDHRAVAASVLSRAELLRLHRWWLDADRRGAFFASGTIVVAYGRCPAQPPAREDRGRSDATRN